MLTSNKKLNDQEKISWLRLSRSQNVGKVTFFHLIEIFGNPTKALENIADFSLKGGLKKPITVYSEAEAQKELENCRKIGAEIICFDEGSYPKLLREISDPPPILTIRGEAALLNRSIIAIVGPRNASINGCKFAKKIAAELGEAGLVIASGMARGIDTAAHIGSLNSGTIAVIAGGIDHIYPPENAELYGQIAQKGIVISENAFGTPPRGGNFPQRNRIISGISLGAVIVEATLKSGTLITARFALEQNREIFAVPGSPFDPRCQGTNRLIKQGAKLIENAADILEEINQINLNLEFQEKEQPEFSGFEPGLPEDNLIDEARKLILEKLNFSEITADEIITELQIPAKIVNIALVQLELADRIQNRNGKIILKAEL